MNDDIVQKKLKDLNDTFLQQLIEFAELAAKFDIPVEKKDGFGGFSYMGAKSSEKGKMCEHKNVEYCKDPSGNNDSGTQCLDCGAWL